MQIGPIYQDNKCKFRVWAPNKNKVSLNLIEEKNKKLKMELPMAKKSGGHWEAFLDNIKPGAKYFFKLDGKILRPDPASHFQPDGVHGPSSVVDHSFKWEDKSWNGIGLREMIIYELHVGTFTNEGTFNKVISNLGYLNGLGINTIEIMPVAQFPGSRNWGYDGAYAYAVQNSYGGPLGLKKLVNECHKKGISVILDVVYNHFGPEGNYAADFGPYFSEKYDTPWGKPLNFDGPDSNGVRNFFVENAVYWLSKYHIDALRLDAVHSIFDSSRRHFLLELSQKVNEISIKHGKKYYLIAETNLNDSKLIKSANDGGYGINAQWLDDFHHSLHTLLTKEKRGYYEDYGKMHHMIKALTEGFVYSGQYSRHRNKKYGTSSIKFSTDKFVVFAQNHDQTGNRMLGDRLSTLVSFEAVKLAAGLTILSPYIPLIFMGEEYGEKAPFLYFVSHSDKSLIDAVRRGRKDEFKSFRWSQNSPDPQSPKTFLKSKISLGGRKKGNRGLLLKFYKKLIEIRRFMMEGGFFDRKNFEAYSSGQTGIISMRHHTRDSAYASIFNFNKKNITAKIRWPGIYSKVLYSSEKTWNGPKSALSNLSGKIRYGNKIKISGQGFVVFKKLKLI